MSQPLRVLLLEESKDDARLIVNELSRAGFEPLWHRAEIESEFLAQLDSDLDIILADHCLPQFDALRAVDLMRGLGLDVPVIMVTGVLDDASAVKCLKQGACDYLLKDRLARLGPAVTHALEQTRSRADRRRAEHALCDTETSHRTTHKTGPDDLITIDHQERIIAFNAVVQAIFGPTRGEAVGRSVTELLLPPGWRECHPCGLMDYLTAGECPMIDRQFDMTARRADGTEVLVELAITCIRNGQPQLFKGHGRDNSDADAAKEARCRLADLVEMSDDAIIGESIGGLIMSWNRGASLIFGYRAEEVLGRSLSMLADHEHADESRRLLAQTRAGDRIKHLETVRHRKDGSEIIVSLSIAPIRDTSGLVIGASNLARDLTAQKGTERELTRLNGELQDRVGDLQALLEIVPVAVWIGDATADQIVGNRVAYEMMGLPAGTNISLTSPEARAGTTPGYRCFKNGNEFPADELPMQTVARTGLPLMNVEQDLKFDDGRIVSIQGSFAPLFDDLGKVRGVIGVCVDITGRKLAEEALVTANRRKDEFLATLSHELRTPLTPVLLAVTSMLGVPPTANELKTNLAMIRDNVELQACLIDDLLDIARIAQGKLHFNQEIVDVHTLIHHALDTCRDVINNGRFRMVLDLAAETRFTVADPVRLQQVFWNLIKNAAKFTPPRGEIAIRSRNEPASEAGFSGESLIVEISDTGIGIETEALERIFQVFEQCDCSRTRRLGGLGIGLSVSRSLIEAHAGRLTAASAGKDRGATFTIVLPAQTEPAPVLPTPRTTDCVPPGHQPLKILLVDDNKDTLRFLGLALSQRHHSVRPAVDLASARRLAASDDFDLLISDLGLPDGSGLELMREIKQTRGFPGIACSGFGSDDDIRMSIEAGFSAHLTKPIDFQALEATMRQVVLAAELAAALS